MNFIKINKKRIALNLILILTINLILNYNFFLSLLNPTKPITYTKKNFKTDYITYEIENINKKINMIEIEFEKKPDKIIINYTSKNFKNYIHLNKSYENNNIKRQKIIILTSINEKIKNLQINSYNGKIQKITLNPNIKYKINLIPTIIIYLIILFIKDTITKNEKLDLNKTKQLYITGLTITLFISIAIAMCFKYNETYKLGFLYEKYYTDAIMKGQLNLDYPVSKELKKDKNPYDTSTRDYEYLWDASYYKGKYYCYFGIWPIISLFIPYKLITNTYLSCPFASLTYTILGILSTYLLYHAIIKKYFNKISYQTYITTFIFILSGSKILWCASRPEFYETVALAAYFHTTLGLYLVLFSNNKIKNFIGYTLLALNALCRPTTLIYSILIIPKIINNIKTKKFKLIDFIILTTPYLIIGIITMYLNYIRFDSIFEFGISYQLTTNNLKNYSFSPLNSLYGTINYLFSGININLIPFKITETIPIIPIITDFHIENIGGGTITTSIIGIIIFFTPKILKKIKEKELKLYIKLSLTLGIIIIIFSSGIGALIGRYMLDFNYIFYFITAILSLTIINNKKNTPNINKIYIILITTSIIINILLTTTNTI